MPEPRTRPYSRARVTAQWLAAAACALLLVMYAVSARWAAETPAMGGYTLGFDRGRAELLSVPPGHRRAEWTFYRRNMSVLWGFERRRWVTPSRTIAWAVSVPFWAPAGALALGTAALWRRGRGRPGLCPACRFDLSGLPPGAACPECGRCATGPVD